VGATRILIREMDLGGETLGSPWDPGSHDLALVLGRLHGAALGQVRVELCDGRRTGSEVLAYVRNELSSEIARHLNIDRESGSSSGEPACVVERREALKMAPPLTVVIPTRDRPERLRRCISSMLEGSYPKDRLEILVVDNGSTTDETKKVVEALSEVTQITYLSEHQSGSASARNRALPEIRTEFAVFTDDDTRIDEHWLIEIVRGFWSDERADVVTGLLLPSALETPAQIWFEEYGGFSRGFTRRIFDVNEHWPLDEPLFPFSAGLFGTGNNMAFRTSALRQIGGFDPALGNGTPALGGVDSEVLLRSVLLGHRLVYQPSAIIYHEHRREFDALKRQVFSYGTGLSAYLSKTLWSNPALIPFFLSLVPRGLVFEADPRSKKNARKGDGYPKALTLAELKGIAYGPLAYIRSRRAYGPHVTPKAVPEARHRPIRSKYEPSPRSSAAS
jgi:glycosyltransferase involved in cell wall biosynthesis